MRNTQQKPEQSQENEKSESEMADSDFTCEICIEPLRANNKVITTSKCKHDFCSDCIAQYIESQVESNIANIKCPTLECKFSWDPLSCRPVISNHLFNKWCDLLCKAAVLRYYPKRFVYCPYRHCSALIVNECEDEAQKFTCPNCKNNLCFRCRSPWHAGYRCLENGIYKDTNDILFRKLIEEKKWTRCPLCGNAVERNGGCPVINCRCGSNFCHVCGKVKFGVQSCCNQGPPELPPTCIVASIIILLGICIIAVLIE